MDNNFNNKMSNEEKKNKKKRLIALLAFLTSAIGVAGASVPLFLERFNYHSLPDEIKPKVKVVYDHDNKGTLELELTPELAGKKVTALFEDEHGRAHLIKDLVVGSDGKVSIDTSSLPQGSRYTFKQLHSDTKSGSKPLLNLSDVLPKNKTIDKTHFYDKNGDLVFQKNFGKSQAGKKVKVAIKNHDGGGNGTTKVLEVTLDENGIAKFKPSDIDEFKNNPNGKYSIEKFMDEDDNEISKEIATNATNQNLAYGKMPILVDKKNKYDLSKWRLPQETPYNSKTKVLVSYVNEKGEHKVAEIPVISEDGSLNGMLNQDAIKNSIPKNAAIDFDNIKLKDENGQTTPLRPISDDQYQHDNHLNKDNLKLYVGNPNSRKGEIAKPVEFTYKTVDKNGVEKKISITKKPNEDGYVDLPTANDLIEKGGKGYVWELEDVTTASTPKKNLYDPKDIDKISTLDLVNHAIDDEAVLSVPVGPNEKENQQFEAIFEDESGNTYPVKGNAKNGVVDFVLPETKDGAKPKLKTINKINDNQDREDVTKDLVGDLKEKNNPYNKKLEKNNNKYVTPSLTEDPITKSLSIEYPLGKENANKDVTLIAKDNKGNLIKIKGKTDQNGIFNAENDDIRGLDLTLEKFVDTNDENNVIVDLTQSPDKVKNLNASTGGSEDGEKELIFDVSPNTDPNTSEATGNDNPNKKPKAIIINEKTGEIREVDLVPENNIHSKNPDKPIWKLPLSELKDGEKVDKVIDKNNSDEILISNANIPEEQKYKHKTPTVKQELTDDRQTNDIVISDLPNTLKPGDFVIVELEGVDSEGNPIKISVPAKVNDNNEIVVDANDLPKDSKLEVKNIYQNKSPGKGKNDISNGDKGYKLVDVPNALDKDKNVTIDAKHVHKISALKPLIVFENDNFNDIKIKIQLEDLSDLIKENSQKPIVTIVNQNNKKITFEGRKINYLFENGKKYIIFNPTVENQNFSLNDTYTVSKIEYRDGAFDPEFDQTIGHNWTNVIYDKSLEKPLELLEDYSHILKVVAINKDKSTKIEKNSNDKYEQITISVDLETNLTPQQLNENNFVLVYRNKSNSKDIVYNINKAPSIVATGDNKFKATFVLEFPQSNREYELVGLKIGDTKHSIENFDPDNLNSKNYQNLYLENDNNIKTSLITEKGETKVETLKITPTDVDTLDVELKLTSDDAFFEKNQEFVVKYDEIDENGNVIPGTSKTITVSPRSVKHSVNNLDQQHKEAEFKFEIPDLKENTKYKISNIELSNSNQVDSWYENPLVDQKDFEISAEINPTLQETTLDSTAQITSIKPMNTTSENVEIEYDKLVDAFVSLKFENILKKWKEQKIVLEFKSKHFDEVVHFSQVITSTQDNKIAVPFQLDSSVLHANREYELTNIYAIDATKNVVNFDATNSDLNPIQYMKFVGERPNDFVLSFKTKAHFNNIRVSSLEQQQVTSIFDSKLRINIADIDDVLVENQDQLEVVYKLKDLQNPETRTLNLQKDSNGKYIELEINNLITLNQNNEIVSVKLKQKPTKAIFDLWKDKELNISEEDKIFKNEIKIDFVGVIDPQDATVDSTTNKISAQVELPIFVSSHINKNTLNFKAKYTQNTQSYNRDENSREIFSNGDVKIVDDKITLDFSDLVSNRLYNNFELYVNDSAFNQETPATKNSIKQQLVSDLSVAPRETKVIELTNANSRIINNNKKLKLKYEIQSEDEILNENINVNLVLTPLGNFNYKFIQNSLIKKENDKYVVEFDFDIVANVVKSNKINRFVAGRTYEDGVVEEELQYSVELKFNSKLPWANTNINVKDKNDQFISSNRDNILINAQTKSYDAQNPDFEKNVGLPREALTFAPNLIFQQHSNKPNEIVYTKNSSTNISLEVSSNITKQIRNQELRLVFSYIASDGSEQEIATNFVKVDPNNIIDISQPNKKLIKFIENSSANKINWKANREYTFKRLEIKTPTLVDGYSELKNDQNQSFNISGQFKISQNASEENVKVKNASFIKEESTIDKAIINITLQDVDDVLRVDTLDDQGNTKSNPHKEKLVIKLAKKADVADSSKWITVDKNTQDANIEIKKQNKDKIISFSLNNLKVNNEYVIVYLGFEDNNAALDGLPFTINQNSNKVFDYNDEQKDIAIKNQLLRISNNPTWNINDIDLSIDYKLESQMFKLDGSNFVAHYTDILGQNYFSKVVSAQNLETLNIELTNTENTRNNNTYTLKNVYVASNTTKDEFNTKTTDTEKLSHLQNNWIPLVKTVITNDHASVTTEPSETKAVVKEKNSDYFTATHEGVKFDLAITTKDKILKDNLKVKVTFAIKEEDAIKYNIPEGSKEYVLQNQALTNIDQDKNSAEVVIDIQNGLIDDVNYYVKEVIIEDFDLNTQGAAFKFNKNNIIAQNQNDIFDKPENEKKPWVFHTLEQPFNIISLKTTKKEYKKDEINDANNITVKFDALQQKWVDQKMVLIYKSKHLNEKVYYSHVITQEDKNNKNSMSFRLENSFALKHNRQYELVDIKFGPKTSDIATIDDTNVWSSLDNTKVPKNDDNTNGNDITVDFKVKPSANVEATSFIEKAPDSVTKSKLYFAISDSDGVLSANANDKVRITYKLKNSQNPSIQTQYLPLQKDANGAFSVEFDLDNIELNSEYVIEKIEFENLPINAIYNINTESDDNTVKNTSNKDNFKNKFEITETEVDPTIENIKTAKVIFNLDISQHLDHLKNNLEFIAQIKQNTASNNRNANDIIWSEVATLNNNQITLIFNNNLVSNRKYSDFKFYVKDNNTNIIIPNNDKTDGSHKVNDFEVAPQVTEVIIENKVITEDKVQITFKITSPDEILEANQVLELLFTNDDSSKTYKFKKEATITMDVNDSNVARATFELEVDVFDDTWLNQQNSISDKIEENFSYHFDLKFVNKPSRANTNIKLESLDSINNTENHLVKENANSVDRAIVVPPISIVFENNFKFKMDGNEISEYDPNNKNANQFTIEWKFDKYVTNAIRDKFVSMTFCSNDGICFSTEKVQLENNLNNKATKKVALTFNISDAEFAKIKANRQYNFKNINIFDNANANSQVWQDSQNTQIQGNVKVLPSQNVEISSSAFDQANTTVEKTTIVIQYSDADDIISENDVNDLVLTYHEEASNNDIEIRHNENGRNVTINPKTKTITVEIPSLRLDKKYLFKSIKFNNNVANAAYGLVKDNNTNNWDKNELLSNEKLIENNDLKLVFNNTYQGYKGSDETNPLTTKDITKVFKLENNKITINNKTKIKAHFSDISNKNYLVDVEYDDNAKTLTVQNIDASEIRHNNKYKLEAIFFATEPEINAINRDDIANTTANIAKIDIQDIINNQANEVVINYSSTTYNTLKTDGTKNIKATHESVEINLDI
ncbi:hypothetical protein [Mesomycoplasma neurolyticum]|uniref:DUF1410 domain n=1 Tax=Mesomycoplasma neurolyticum TaxID=2120 RepID=A0A449A5A4_9BACT|nr:hypothetical protein [Mesomycoplasma neurolyticum]VEU59470.1 DUF1410 domain [Mesomycoplasma neurolyticum]